MLRGRHGGAGPTIGPQFTPAAFGVGVRRWEPFHRWEHFVEDAYLKVENRYDMWVVLVNGSSRLSIFFLWWEIVPGSECKGQRYMIHPPNLYQFKV
jgi:hypothetical protein